MITQKCLRCQKPRLCEPDDLYCDDCDQFFRRVKKLSARVSPPGIFRRQNKPQTSNVIHRKPKHHSKAT